MTRLRPASRPSRTRRIAQSVLGLAGSASLVLAPVARAQDGGLDSGQSEVILDTEINEILHRECDPVFIAAGLDPKHVTIVLQTHVFNAANASNQLFFLGTDLIEKTDSPNELIGVMAHETGHAAGYHAVRQGEMQKAGMVPMLLTMALGVIAAAAGGASAGAALLGSSQYFGALGALGYSREQEARADQAAVTYLEKSGQSAKGLVDFFDQFRYEEVFDEAHRYRFFNNHPITGDRIELLRKRAMEQPHYDAVDDPNLVEEHEIMKAKLVGFIEPPQTAFFRYPDSDHSFVARYARAIAYYRETETDKALDAIDSLIGDYPNHAIQLDPDDFDGGDSFAYRLLAQAYDAKGQDGLARLATAEERFSEGDYTQARVFALRARERLSRNAPEYRRATDIVLTSQPTVDDLKALGGRGG